MPLRMSNAGAAGPTEQSPSSSPSASSPPASDVALAKQLIATAAANRLVAAWRKFHRLLKPLEQKAEAARAKVLALMVDAGVTEFATAHGLITIRTKASTNWEALARSVLRDDVVNGLKEKFTKQSSPFISALPGWGSDS